MTQLLLACKSALHSPCPSEMMRLYCKLIVIIDGLVGFQRSLCWGQEQARGSRRKHDRMLQAGTVRLQRVYLGGAPDADRGLLLEEPRRADFALRGFFNLVSLFGLQHCMDSSYCE